jgi:hypothetical protein
MKRRRVLIILAVAFIFAIVAVMVWPMKEEPVYQGKKLSEWFLESRYYYNQPGWGETEGNESANAVREIGTNALPFLLDWTRYRRPAWRARLLPAFNALTPWIKRMPVVRSVSDDRQVARAELAPYGFALLGPRAVSAVPALCCLVHPTNAAPLRAAILKTEVFYRLGSNAFPSLMGVLTNHAELGRAGAIEGLRQAGLQEQAADELAACMHDGDQNVALSAIGALGDFGPRWSSDTPIRTNVLEALANALRDSRAAVRKRASDALFSFREGQRVVLPALLAARTDPDPEVRRSVTNALFNIEGVPFWDIIVEQ